MKFKFATRFICRLLLVFSTLLSLAAGAYAIVINEIMYNPASGSPLEEYIELYNTYPTNVNLGGWRLANGVDFVFPSNTIIYADSYLVVAAHIESFSRRYGSISNVVGSWITIHTTNINGRTITNYLNTLSNSRNTIRLLDNRGQEIDSIRYADEGDWAIRKRRPTDQYGLNGWIWHKPHDGGGKSLELINPNMPDEYGQNWSSSSPDGGTPGRKNSVFSTNIPPLILNVRHNPVIPRSTNTVTITARILDEKSSNITVKLYWRVDSTSPGQFTAVNMVDDGTRNDGISGDGIYGAFIPPQPDQTIIEFYIEARDADGLTRTYPAPTIDENLNPLGQINNLLYQVDNTTYTGVQPLYKVVMRASEYNTLINTIFANVNNAARSDAEMNATFISIDNTGVDFRYLVGVRNRGHGTRVGNPHNVRINFCTDNTWNGVIGLNINARYTHSQILGAALATASGLAGADSRPVQLRINNQNLGQSSTVMYNTTYACNEVINADWAEHRFPNDNNGNIYRTIRDIAPPDFNYRGENKNSYTNTCFKRNNEAEDDWSDLIGMLSVVGINNTIPFTTDNVRRVINVEQWMRHLAFVNILGNNETGLNTGYNDDYMMYRGVYDPRFILIHYDLDTILGMGGSLGTSASIFTATQNNGSGRAFDRLMKHPDFAPVYFEQMLDLLNTSCAPERFNPLVDQVLSEFVPDNVRSSIKSWMASRAAYIRSVIPTNLTVEHSLSILNGYPRTTTTPITLSGYFPAVSTRKVLVNGVSATLTNWQARWQLSTIQLKPGINKILVQALDSNGLEIARTNLDVWYDTGSITQTGGTLQSDTVLSGISAPVMITNTLIVPSGITLTLSAGATIYFAQDAGLQVQGCLKINGESTNRVRLTRQPGTSAIWNGIKFINTTQDNVIVYADIEFANIGNQTILVSNSVVRIENTTFSSITNIAIRSIASGLTVKSSVFSASPQTAININSAHPDGMDIVIDGNQFGLNTGAGSDVIVASGVHRPLAVLQILNNSFSGGGDEAIELSGTSALIEGNRFINFHKNSSSAVAGECHVIFAGADAVTNSELVIVRNLFSDNDYCLGIAGLSTAIVDNNTIVNSTKAVANFHDTALSPAVLPGSSARFAGDILWNNANVFTNFYVNHPIYGTTEIAIDFSIVPPPYVSAGVGNISADPMFRGANDFTLSEGSPARGSGVNGLDMGAFVPSGASISGEPLSPACATTATLFVSGPAITNYKFRLNNGAYSEEFPVYQPIILSGLQNRSTNRVYVLGKNAVGVWQNPQTPTISKEWIVDTTRVPIKINELLARNDTAYNHYGTFPDLIELINESDTDFDLADMSITDDFSAPRKFVFPRNTIVPARGYLILIVNNPDGTPGIHLGFNLNQNGDNVFLFDAPSRGGSLIDSVEFGLQIPDYSIGRLPDGSWGLTLPTFGSKNIARQTGSPAVLKINEFTVTSQVLTPTDFLELYNPSSVPVMLSGLHLTDEWIGNPSRYTIKNLSFINANGYALFYADGNTNAGADHLNFRFTAEQGQVALLSSNFSLIDFAIYVNLPGNVSWARCPDGGTNIMNATLSTPGLPNACPAQSIAPTTITIIPAMNVWLYNTAGVDLGTAWKEINYDDSAWQSGPALLFEPPSRTYTLPAPVGTYLPPANGVPTYYFRTYFVIPPSASFSSLQFYHIVDDGAVFYLNGVELARFNLPATGTITYSTLTTAAVTDAAQVGPVVIQPSLLRPGTNVFAVELHQNSPTSADLCFGLILEGLVVTNQTALNTVRINEIMAINQTITNESGKTPDWVELYNTSDSAFDLSGMSIGDSTGNRWYFPQGSIILPKSFYVVYLDNNSPPSIINTGFGLKSTGDRVYLYDKPPQSNTIVDSITFGIQTPDFSIGRIPDGSTNINLTHPTPGASNRSVVLGSPSVLKINEWMANPDGGDDWFELYNPQLQPVAIGGLWLADNLSGQPDYQIPPLSFIGVASNAYLVFIADNNTIAGADHVNFGLSATGETIGLFASDGFTLIDGVQFDSQQNGVSEGRLPDGATNIVRFWLTSSPGSANYLPLTNIVISEVLTHTDLPLEDAIELQNISDSPVDISGWYLSDDKDVPQKFIIPQGTVLAPGSFAVFYEYQFNNDIYGIPFALNAIKGDQVYLFSTDQNGRLNGYRASVKFGSAPNGVSFGRVQTSVGADFVLLQRLTFGTDVSAQSPTNMIDLFRTGKGASNSAPIIGPIVITEIMYHPPDIGTNDNVLEEFIELYNISSSAVPLFDPEYPTNGWRLKNAVSFNFNSNHFIPPGGYMIVVSFDPQTEPEKLEFFQNRYGTNFTVVGGYSGKLNNSSDTIELYRPAKPILSGEDAGYVPYILVERVTYSDSIAWLTNADGHGFSLQRVNPLTFGNEPTNWFAAPPTPGGSYSYDSDNDGMPDSWERQFNLDPFDPQDALLDPDGDGMNNIQEFLSGTNPSDAASSLRLDIILLNNNLIKLKFNAVSGRTYQILYSLEPALNRWQTLTNISAIQTDSVIELIEPNISTNHGRFYRLLLGE